MTPHLHLDRRDGLCIFRLDRPKANAIDLAFSEELGEALDGLANDPDLKALVVTGTGSNFCAGLDLKAIPFYTVEEQDRLIQSVNRLLLRLYGFPRPVVAAAGGHAIAGGMLLLLACDYRVGTDNPAVRFGLTEARVGVAFPLAAKEVVLNELGGPAARRMMLTGAVRDARAALADGALDELCSGADLLERALEVAGEMAALPLRSYRAIKEQLRGAALGRIREALERESDPLLGHWLDSGAAGSAARLLGKKPGEADR